jgi:hypothetical protein
MTRPKFSKKLCHSDRISSAASIGSGHRVLGFVGQCSG